MTFAKVHVVRSVQSDDEVFDSPAHLLVALTRHTESLTYTTVRDDAFYQLIVAGVIPDADPQKRTSNEFVTESFPEIWVE